MQSVGSRHVAVATIASQLLVTGVDFKHLEAMSHHTGPWSNEDQKLDNLRPG